MISGQSQKMGRDRIILGGVPQDAGTVGRISEKESIENEKIE
jgi:hypothetical protein